MVYPQTGFLIASSSVTYRNAENNVKIFRLVKVTREKSWSFQTSNELHKEGQSLKMSNYFSLIFIITRIIEL